MPRFGHSDMTDAINSPGQTGLGNTLVPASSIESTSGNFRGERVDHLRNPTAKLQEAAEELTFTRSERAGKKLAQRKLASDREQFASLADQARRYLDKVPDLERSQKLSDFASQTFQQDNFPTPNALRQRAEAFSDDPTHQFLALAYIHSAASQRDASPETIAAIEHAMDGLRVEQGPAIQAGLNISTVAHNHSGGELGSTQSLRDLYRNVVIDCDNIKEAFDRVVQDYPSHSFDEAIQFLLNALGTDLSASTQSVSRPRLKQILNDMYQLKSLNSIHRQCEDLLRRTDGSYGASGAPNAARNLVSELLTAESRAWQGADAFSSLPEKMGVAGTGGTIYLLNGFKELVRFLPSKAFGEDQALRERIMISIQQALDEAIDSEEFDA